MNKNKFIGLIFMMVISLAGIIGVQMVWINNAIGIRNEIFDNTVLYDLNDVAHMLETNRQTAFLNNYVSKGNLSNHDKINSGSGNLSITSYISKGGTGLEININSFLETPVNKTISSNSNIRDESISDKSLIPNSVSNIRSSPETNMYNEPDLYTNSDEFMKQVQSSINELQLQGEKLISDIYDWEKNIVIDKNEVKNTLQRRLLLSNINTPFEFAIIKDGKINNGYYKQTKESDFWKSIYKVPLFSDRIFKQDVVLSVVFPQKNNYVLGSMSWVLGGSMLFSLIMLATFGMSLYFIIRQKKISEMKSDFINNMTHEFKTPIATISLAADTITNPKVINDESGIRHFIGMIKKENSRMNKQVESILQIATLDKKEMDFVFEDISIHTLIERAVETIGIQVLQKEGTINLDLKAENPIIYGDSEHLTNLFHNLLDNANKYSPETPEIKVSTINVDKGIQISVEDKGIGMTKAVQSKIFERFYRQTSGNIHNVKGFGLGLSYAKAIVEAHKGSITVTSEPENGSRFDIYLPFKGS
jgi:two-component system, OmpR family, phosphate regulon sensor histidine kinase PhoR